MTRSTTTIEFHDLLQLLLNIPNVRDDEEKLKKVVRRLRQEKQEEDFEAGRINKDDLASIYDLISDADRKRIKCRAVRYLECLRSSTGMYHLSEENRARLTPLRER